MAFYMDSKRIPPERLVDRPPQDYDRILQTYDIDGARSRIKKFDPESHNFSLKTNDIKGAQPKKNIRNIWGSYDYNPTDKNLTRSQAYMNRPYNQQDQVQQSVQNPEAGLFSGNNHPQGVRQYPERYGNNVNPNDPNNQDLMRREEKMFLERRHNNVPQGQIDKEGLMKPSEVLQPYLDYDKVVTPYQKPQRDALIYDQYQKDREMQNQKNADIAQKKEEYRLTSNKIRNYGADGLQDIQNQQNEALQYQNNMYRGYTPNGQNQQNGQLQRQPSMQAQVGKNIISNPVTTTNANQPEQIQYDQQQQNYQQPPPQQNYQQPPPPPQQQQQQYDQQQLLNNQYSEQQQQPQYQQQQQMVKPQSRQTQSVANLNSRPWQDHKYNLIAGYVEDKREYKRDQTSKLEREYYQQYNADRANELRKTQNNPTKPYANHVPKAQIDQRLLDFNDPKDVIEAEKKINNFKINNNIGRSGFFDEFGLKPHIASHHRQFIGNTVADQISTNKPQRYGPTAMGTLPNNINDA